MSRNFEEMTVTMNRIEMCDLMIACNIARDEANDGGKKWQRLHDKIKKMIDDFDKDNLKYELLEHCGEIKNYEEFKTSCYSYLAGRMPNMKMAEAFQTVEQAYILK